MFAIRLNGQLLADRYATWDEAVEAAQESHALPPEADWTVVEV